MKKAPRPRRPLSTSQAVPTWFLAVVTLPILLGLLWFGRDFLIPIALATLLFILNMALIDRLDSASIAGHSVPRWLAYVSVTAFMFLAFIGFGYILSNQAVAVSEAAPRYTARLASLKVEIENFLGTERVSVIERSIAEADVNTWLANFAASASGAIGNVGLVLLYLAFMLGERGAFAEKLPRLCPTPQEAKRLADALKSISLGVRQYMWINAVTSAMSGTLAFIVLKVLGVDFAASLALIVFILNFIPSIGSFLAVLFPTLLALLQFDTITPALVVVVVYGGGDAIIGNIVQPRLQGKSLNLSALMVMVALAFWGMMWGGVGAFMAVPLTVVIMIVCSQIPGLRPFAQLLSSDGVLPGDENNDPTTVAEEVVDPLGKPQVQPEGTAL
jgi:AI-2 transport protein TqsA